MRTASLLSSELTFPATWTSASPASSPGADLTAFAKATAVKKVCATTVVDVVSDEAAFAALERPWNDAVARAAVPHPFLRHEWFRSWWESFGAGRRLHIIVARSEGRIAAIAPFMLERARIHGVPVRRLAFLQNDHTPRADFIVAEDPRSSYDAIWRALAADRQWDVVQMNQLPSCSPTRAEADAWAGRHGFATGAWQSEESPYLEVTGSWEDFQRALTPKFRQNLRNRTGRLRRTGEPAIEILETPAAIREALPDAIRLEASGWKHDTKTSISSDPAVQKFYTVLAERAAARGWLRLAFLTVGGTRIAATYAAQYDNRFFLLKTGYDPTYAACSPFKVLTALALERAFADGLREFDFGGDAEPWKLEWTTTRRPLEWRFIFSRTPAGRLAHFMKFVLAPAIKRLRG